METSICVAEFAEADLGTGKIDQDQAITPEPLRDRADTPDILLVTFQGAMGEVEPGHIHSVQDQLL